MNDEPDSPILHGDELIEAIQNKEWPDEYDDIPRYSELSKDEQEQYDTLARDFALAAGLEQGLVPNEGKTFEKLVPGDDKAEALGHAYVTRDQIEANGGEVELEYVGPEVIISPKLYHTVRFTITDGGE